MAGNILKTKLYIPQTRNGMVARHGLTKRLDDGIHSRLILVSAPAGFGKTTLVSDWVQDCTAPVAWLSLDDKDNDLPQFIAYLITALQNIMPQVANSVPENLPSLDAVGVETVLTTLINKMTSITGDLALVLDDYHCIHDQGVHGAIHFLVEQLPPRFTIVMITREDPPFPLAKLRARNQLVEIRASDLRFSYREATEFLNKTMGLQLSEQDIGILEEKTEGWIAGLQLAALSLKGSEDIKGFLDSFSGSHYFIMDYLIEEVLKRQSDQMQLFLLKVSLLDRFCGSLCDAVAGDPDRVGQTTLENLQLSNLFVIPLDSERKWYRFHHLFSELLRQRLASKFTQEAIDDLHKRASDWFEKNSLPGEAIWHAVAAKDFYKAAALIELSWYEMDKSYQSATWIKWVRMIPEAMIRKRPVLSVGYAWALLDTGDMEGCEPRLKEAEKCLKLLSGRGEGQDFPAGIIVSDKEQLRFLTAIIATARAYLTSAMGDHKSTIRFGNEALALLPDEEEQRRGIVYSLLSLAQWANGDLEEAIKTIRDSIKNAQMEVQIAVVLADLFIEFGQLDQAKKVYENALRAAFEGDAMYQIPVASFYLGLSKVCWLRGQNDEAEAHLERSMEKGQDISLPNWRYQWHFLKARMTFSNGDLPCALDYIDQAEKYYFRNPIPDPQPLDAMRARIFAKSGMLTQALNWKNEQHDELDELCYLNEFSRITLVRVLLAQSDGDNTKTFLTQAQKLLERLLTEAQRGKRAGSIIEILILSAIAYDRLGEPQEAAKRIKEAVSLSEPQGYIQPFLEEGLAIHRLLSNPEQARTVYVTKMLEAIEKSNGLNASQNDYKMGQGMVEPLSEREMEMLKLISMGLSNQEIAKRLFLALSTVKGYNQNLFGKLQVKSRMEAIIRARELGLLS